MGAEAADCAGASPGLCQARAPTPQRAPRRAVCRSAAGGTSVLPACPPRPPLPLSGRNPQGRTRRGITVRSRTQKDGRCGTARSHLSVHPEGSLPTGSRVTLNEHEAALSDGTVSEICGLRDVVLWTHPFAPREGDSLPPGCALPFVWIWCYIVHIM